MYLHFFSPLILTHLILHSQNLYHMFSTFALHSSHPDNTFILIYHMYNTQ